MGKTENMDSRGQKAMERRALDELIRLYPAFPRGKIRMSESPDFIVRTGRKQKTGIELTRLTRSEEMLFSPGERFYPAFSLEAIRQLIVMKETKIGLYMKKRLDQIWLVILVEDFDLPSTFNIHNHLDHWTVETSFQAVLILHRAFQKVYEIKSPTGTTG
ncbi:MAG: hypothetical protein ACWGNV_12905 [Bacteroidales bacterium]